MAAELLFERLVSAHIATGTIGLVALWVPIVGRKGTERHRRWGRVFAASMLLTGAVAVGISLCTLAAPLATHPYSDDEAFVRGVFGWMMLYLATMTVMLAWYGVLCIRNRRHHARNRSATNLALQAATFLTALNCAAHGAALGNPLMVGISCVGLAAAVLNTRFILRRDPPADEWLIQHTRGIVGAGISVYTAFLAFGAVNLLPQYAFAPVVWATPCTLGVAYLLYHQVRITGRRRTAARTAGPAVAGTVAHGR